MSPFIGIETSMTRREMGDAAAPAPMPPADAAISLEQALAGNTVNGAAQLGLEDEFGAIKTGFLADFIVLPHTSLGAPGPHLVAANSFAPVSTRNR